MAVQPTYERLCQDEDLDLVILCTPPGQHAAQAAAALEAGLNVFVEKPFATEWDGLNRVIETAGATNRVVAVDYPMIYSPLIQAVMLFEKSRLAGPLLRVSVENIASAEGLHGGHWFWKPELSGGIFVEHGVHFFDWVGRMAGEAERVVALSPEAGGASGLGRREDRVFAAVKHAGGTLATYFHAFIATPESERTRTVVSFEDLDIVLDGWIPATMHLRGRGAAVGTTTIRRMMSRTVASIPDATTGFIFDAGKKLELYAQGVRAAAEDMARSIREPGYVARNDVRIAIDGLRVAFAAREAARSSSEVRVLPVRSAAPL